MWLLAARFLPANYSMPPNKMEAGCVLLLLITAVLLNVELEGGALSAPVVIVIFSIIWSLVLIPLCFLVKYFNKSSNGKGT